MCYTASGHANTKLRLRPCKTAVSLNNCIFRNEKENIDKQGTLFSSVHAPVLNLAEFVVICVVPFVHKHPAVETRRTATVPC